MKKIAVLLSGCGVYDGSEIQEAVFSLLAIAKQQATYQCFAPNCEQHHVINHLNGEEQPTSRNVLVEAARIARGDIKDLVEFDPQQFDALVIPGGFGAAKNLTQWAFEGPNGSIRDDVSRAIQATHAANKYIVALCMGPTVVAKALEKKEVHPVLTVGTDSEPSPYDIKSIAGGLLATGAQAVMKSKSEIAVDRENKIISAPCYMMESDIITVHKNIELAINELFTLL